MDSQHSIPLAVKETHEGSLALEINHEFGFLEHQSSDNGTLLTQKLLNNGLIVKVHDQPSTLITIDKYLILLTIGTASSKIY